MNALTSLWLAPVAASPFAWIYAGHKAGRAAALLTVSISISMMIAGVGRMMVMQSINRIQRPATSSLNG